MPGNYIAYINCYLEHGYEYYDASVPVYINLYNLETKLELEDVFYTFGDDDLDVEIPYPIFNPELPDTE